MCGIVGIFDMSGAIDQGQLDRFTDAIAHRGPDGRGTYIGTKVGLGHRRLAILDLSTAGQCPMCYRLPNGLEYWITFNGEIYNFLEIRAELKKQGYVFQTETDTEVILAAYIHWNEDCLNYFNGMWAFAIWSVADEKLFLARDRFGIKPLYYTTYQARLAFASELKAFLALEDFTPQLNEAIIPQVLNNAFAYEGLMPDSLMQGVYKLPAGYVMTINRRGQSSLRRWWNTSDHLNLESIPQDYAEQVEHFKVLFEDAVRLRMRSDVPTGTALSGGVDSSAVVCQIADLYQKNVHHLDLSRCFAEQHACFVASFPGNLNDETHFAKQVIEHTRSKAHYWTFNNEASVQHLIDSVWSMEDVYGAIAIPIWSLYREMRQNQVFVSLDGHGGDELLGGYNWYLDWPVSQFGANLYRDFHYTLLPSILRNYDRCSMAHGVEVRMPIMDYRLVTYAFSLPTEAKMGGGFTKRIFRDSMAGSMPDNIRLRRSKMGFNSPMTEWFNSGFIPVIEYIVNHPLWLNSPYWDGKQLREFVLYKSYTRSWTYEDWNTSLAIWTYMNLVLWQLLFIEKMDKEQLAAHFAF